MTHFNRIQEKWNDFAYLT